MKNLRTLALTSLFAVSAMLTGCFEDTTSGSNASPTITDPRLDNTNLTAGGGSTKVAGIISDDNAGLTLTFKVLLGTVDKSSSFTVDFKVPPTDVKTWNIGVDGLATIKALAGAANGNYTLVYNVADKDGATSSANVAFTVGGGSSGTATTLVTTGVVYDVNGPNKGAYDLVGDAGVSASAAETTKDIKDITGVGFAFDGSLSSGNGATFVKAASGFNYDAATVESIAAAYTGTSYTTTPILVVGDVWIVKTARAGVTKYIAIKITEVKSEATAANDGFVKFSYRK